MATGPDPSEGRGASEETDVTRELAAAEQPSLAEAADSAGETEPADSVSAADVVEVDAAPIQEVALATENIAAPSLDEAPEAGKTQLEAAATKAASFAGGLQAIVVEATDYSKKTFDNRLAFYEKLRSAKSFERALEIQSEYAKASYSDFVAEAGKLRELYGDLAKAAFKPIATAIGQDAKV